VSNPALRDLYVEEFFIKEEIKMREERREKNEKRGEKRNRKVALDYKGQKIFLAFFTFLFSLLICTCASSVKAADPYAFIEPAIGKTFDKLSTRLDAKSRIALTLPKSTDADLASHVFEQLYMRFTDAGLNMVDRTDLDMARAEINLGLSGEIDDRTAAALGKFLGASVVAFGEIPELGTTRQRLVYRALEVETGRMLVISIERF